MSHSVTINVSKNHITSEQTVWVDDSVKLGAYLLDLTKFGVSFSVHPSQVKQGECLNVESVLEAFGYLKFRNLPQVFEDTLENG